MRSKQGREVAGRAEIARPRRVAQRRPDTRAQGCILDPQDGREVIGVARVSEDAPVTFPRNEVGLRRSQQGAQRLQHVARSVRPHEHRDAGGLVLKVQPAHAQSRQPIRLEREDRLLQREIEKLVRGEIRRAGRDLHRLGVGQVGAGHDGLQAHARMLISRQRTQQFERVGQASSPRANHARRISARARLRRTTQFRDEFRRDGFMALINAECLLECVFRDVG